MANPGKRTTSASSPPLPFAFVAAGVPAAAPITAFAAPEMDLSTLPTRPTPGVALARAGPSPAFRPSSRSDAPFRPYDAAACRTLSFAIVVRRVFRRELRRGDVLDDGRRAAGGGGAQRLRRASRPARVGRPVVTVVVTVVVVRRRVRRELRRGDVLDDGRRAGGGGELAYFHVNIGTPRGDDAGWRGCVRVVVAVGGGGWGGGGDRREAARLRVGFDARVDDLKLLLVVVVVVVRAGVLERRALLLLEPIALRRELLRGPGDAFRRGSLLGVGRRRVGSLIQRDSLRCGCRRGVFSGVREARRSLGGSDVGTPPTALATLRGISRAPC